MKKIEAIIREEKMNDVVDALIAAEITGITVYQVMGCGTQRGIRKGAADAAKRELDQALSDGGFASCEEARAVRLSEPDLASLSAEIEAYQADYAETLAACERIEASEAASADAEGVEEA